jgi:hypothetical protein
MTRQNTVDATSERLTILITTEKDPFFRDILCKLIEFSSIGETNDFLVVNCSDKMQSHIITAGRIHDCEYIDVIASLRNLEVLNIFTFVTFKLEGSEQSLLSLKTDQIIQELNELAPTGSDERIKMSDIRVFFPSNDRTVPDGDFLSVGAAHSLIVIPQDRFSDIAFPRPLQSSGDSQLFTEHVSAELLSLTGSWKSMTSSPVNQIEGYTSAPGVLNNIGVRLVRSFARSVSLDNPKEVFFPTDTQRLPVPLACSSADVEMSRIKGIADGIFPAEFQSSIIEAKAVNEGNIRGKELLSKLLRRIWRDILSLPKFIGKQFIADLNETVDVFTQQVVGENSWIQVIRDQTYAEGKEDFDQERVINEIETRLTEPSMATSRTTWNNFVKKLFSLSDGGIDFNDLRKAIFADEERIIRNKKLLISEIDQPLEERFQEQLDRENENSLQVHADLPEESSEERSEEPLKEKSEEQVTKDLRGTHLLNTIRQKFIDQTNISVGRVNSKIQSLRDFVPSELHLDDRIIVAVKACLAFSIFLVIVSGISFTGLHENFDVMKSFDAGARAQLFVLITSIVVFVAGLVHVPAESKELQTFLLKLTLGVALPTLIFIIWSDKFVGSGGSDGWLSGTLSRTLGFFIAIALCTFIFSTIRMALPIDGRPLSHSAKKFCGYLLWIYALTMTVVGLNMRINRGSLIENNEILLLILGLSFSSLLFLTAGAIQSIVQIRQTYRRDNECDRYRKVVEDVRIAVDQYKKQKKLLGEWYATEVALDYFLRYPAGKLEVQADTQSESITFLNSLKKFSIDKLELSPQALQKYLEENPSLPPKGWLYSQYQAASARFSAEVGIDPNEANQPETFSDTSTLSSGIYGESGSLRWDFVHRSRRGDYDHELLERYQSLLNVNVDEVLYESFFADEVSELDTILADLTPTDLTVPQALFLNTPLQHSPQIAERMSAVVYWPKIAPERRPSPNSTPMIVVEEVDSYLHHNDLHLQCVRFDYSTFFMLSDLRNFDDNDPIQDDTDDDPLLLG